LARRCIKEANLRKTRQTPQAHPMTSLMPNSAATSESEVPKHMFELHIRVH